MSRKVWWLFALITWFPNLSQSATMCFRGQRLVSPILSGRDVCLWCEKGKFMPEEVHSLRHCYSCSKIENSKLEILVSPCNDTHDTLIHCIDGYYRTQPSYPQDRGHCEKCTECQFPKLPCQKLKDIVCCPGDDYVVYINRAGDTECIPTCDKGRFLDLTNGQCLPCPQNSYMDEIKHINTYCKTCEGQVSSKEIIVHPCNRTHPTVIGCIDGYHRLSSSMKLTDYSECVKVCGRGYYLNSETETCQICPKDTYMDEERHSHTDRCKRCLIPKSRNERIVQPCNSTHETVIGCKDGFYRRLSSDLSTSLCAMCRNCSWNTDRNIFEGRACGETQNTVCCPRPDMSALDALYGPLCVYLLTETTDSLTCGEGEYLSTSTRTYTVTCQPCPQGTYMNETQHTHSSCKSCEQLPNEKYCPSDKADRTSNGEDNASRTADGLAVTAVVLLALLLSMALFVLLHKWRTRGWKLVTGKARNEEIPLLTTTQSGSEEDKISNERFISLHDFSKSHLSVPYCDTTMTEFVRLQADLTVLVNVDVSSAQKAVVFPGTGAYHSNYSYDMNGEKSRPGSGWVENVKIYQNSPCPCETCQKLTTQSVMMKWGEIVICTATSVVFDITEGRKSRCYFSYDSDDKDRRVCPSIYGAMKVISDRDKDWCYMTFVTHDIEMGKMLQRKHADYQRKRSELRRMFGVSPNHNNWVDHPLVIIVSHPYGQSKKISLGKVKSDIKQDGVYIYTNVTDTGSEGARVFILGDTGSRDYGHSHRKDQLSLSGAWSDTEPDMANLSVTDLTEEIGDPRETKAATEGFICLSDFDTSYLPSQYGVSIMGEAIRLQAELSVLVSVDVNSSDRPKDFTCKNTFHSNYSYVVGNESHRGSGWVENVKMYKNRPCPCETCHVSSLPVMKWGEIVICTAASAVFDIKEGRKCRSYFDYDSDDTDLRVCPSLAGAMKVVSDPERDWCYMTFVTHDTELGNVLEERHIRYRRKRSEVKRFYGISGSENMCGNHPLVVIVSHPDGGIKKISLGEVTSVPIQHDDTYSYTNVTDTGSEGARVFILGDTGSRDYGHSHRVRQWSQSGAWSDADPDMADLSVADITEKKEV